MRERLYALAFMCILTIFISCSRSNSTDGTFADALEPVFLHAEIDEQVIYADSDITIKVLSLNMNAEAGPTLVLSAENNSDVDRHVTLRNSSVNSIMVEPQFEMFLYSDRPAISRAVFPRRLLQTANVETFYNISFAIHLAEIDDAENSIESRQIDLRTSMTGRYSQSHEFAGYPVVDAEGIVIKIDKSTESILSQQIYIIIENTLTEDIFVEAVNTAINGIEMDPMFFEIVSAGKKRWTCLTFRDSDIIENGIITIDELTISLEVSSILGPILSTDENTIVFGMELEDETESDSELDSEAESEPDLEVDSEAESEPDSELESEAETDSDSETDSETGNGT